MSGAVRLGGTVTGAVGKTCGSGRSLGYKAHGRWAVGETGFVGLGQWPTRYNAVVCQAVPERREPSLEGVAHQPLSRERHGIDEGAAGHGMTYRAPASSGVTRAQRSENIRKGPNLGKTAS